MSLTNHSYLPFVEGDNHSWVLLFAKDVTKGLRVLFRKKCEYSFIFYNHAIFLNKNKRDILTASNRIFFHSVRYNRNIGNRRFYLIIEILMISSEKNQIVFLGSITKNPNHKESLYLVDSIFLSDYEWYFRVNI